MTFIRHAFAIASALILLLITSVALADMKFAVVDVQRVVFESEDGLRAQSTLKKQFDKRQQDLDAKQTTLLQTRDDIEKQSKTVSREVSERRRDEWQHNMVELQNAFVEFQKDLQKKQAELTQPILNKVINTLRQIAAQDGYDAVFESTAVPYSRRDLDITDKVIQLYNAGSPRQPSDTTKEDKKPATPAPKQPSAKPAGSK